MPMRLRELKKRLAQNGVTFEKPKRGSHYKVRRDGCRPYTLPCPNGDRTELDDRYLKALCRNLNLDFDALMSDED